MKNPFRLPRVLQTAVLICTAANALGQGGLTPAGPPAPGMKTLTQIEPRTPIQSLPGDAINQYIISQPGSYYLTDSIAGVSGKTCIYISAPHVTIDLNGFELAGTGGGGSAGAITGPSPSCAVSNGWIHDWPSGGIVFFGAHCRIENVLAENCKGGILVGDESVVSDCVASQNGDVGIQVGFHSIVAHCAANGNGSGIYLHLASVASDCTASDCGGTGFTMNNFCSAINCASTGNTTGFNPAYSTVVNCSACLNSGNGFILIDSCLIQNCTIALNGSAGMGHGIYTDGTGNRIDGNHIFGNMGYGLQIEANGNFVFRNTLAENGANISVTGTNLVGPIITTAADLATAGPWANFAP